MRALVYVLFVMLSCSPGLTGEITDLLRSCDKTSSVPKDPIDIGRCTGVFETVVSLAPKLDICPPQKVNPDIIVDELVMYIMTKATTSDFTDTNFPKWVTLALQRQWPCKK